MTPLIVCVLSLLLLKEKPPKNYIYSLLIGFFGFVITQYGAIEKLDNANILLIGYVFLNAASVIGMRWAVKKRNKIEGIFFENFIYAAQGVVLFSIFGGFSFKILFSWQVILVSLFAIIHHVFVIIGTQKSKYVSNIILIDFAKVIVAYLSCFVFFDKKPITIEIIGASMIVFALFLIKNKK